MINKRDWNQFKTIFTYEFSGILKNKVYLITTLVLMLAIAIVLTAPSVMNLFKKDTGSDDPGNVIPDPGNENKPIIAVIDNANINAEQVLDSALINFDFKTVTLGEEDLKDKVIKNEYHAGIIIKTPLEFDLYVKNYVMTDTLLQQISGVLGHNYKVTELQKHGITEEEVNRILNSYPISNFFDLGKNSEQSFLYAYILLMFLYIAVNLYGQLVATSVATEKSSRAMELLISSAKPLNFMFGKILGAGIAGLTQLIAIMGVALGFFKINEKAWEDYSIVNSVFDMPVDIFLFTLLFFILGYFLYAFLYGAVGSMVSRIEDINTSVLPITFLYMIAFFIAMASLFNPTGTLIKVTSFIPFFAPTCMFLRICMTTVPFWEILISVILLIVTIILIGYGSAKIYRVGVLMYGKPPKIKELISVIKKKE